MNVIKELYVKSLVSFTVVNKTLFFDSFESKTFLLSRSLRCHSVHSFFLFFFVLLLLSLDKLAYNLLSCHSYTVFKTFILSRSPRLRSSHSSFSSSSCYIKVIRLGKLAYNLLSNEIFFKVILILSVLGKLAQKPFIK